TNLEGTLEMAIKTLKETGQKENALIIMTDGDETTGKVLKLAADAKRAGIYVFTIGMGTELGDFVPDKDFSDGRHHDRAGNAVRSALNAEPLKKLALETGGRFAAATSATSIPEMVKLAISDMEQFEISGRERYVPIEYYQWFVLPGILMLMVSVIAGTRWRGLGPASAAVTTALMMLIPQPAKAGVEEDARRALAEGRHQEAATYFKGLAMAEQNPEQAARYRLAEGNASYLQGNLPAARAAFSEALKSDSPKVRAAAHHGMGSVLFGSGWKRLSRDVAYPNVGPKEEDGKKPNAFGRIADSILGLLKGEKKSDADPMETFDTMVREELSKWMQSEGSEGADSAGFEQFNDVLSDWMDGVKHFDSALRYDPSLENARHNRTLTVKYLKKLREILEEVSENAQQIQPMPAPGQGEGQEGQPQPGDQPGEGDQEGDGQGGDQKRDGKGGDRDKKPNPGGKEGDDRREGGKLEKGEKEGGQKRKDGETPEDAARRILRENADFEKGALNPNNNEYHQPEKDW
ncbi:MAG TPA: VWA domain-containing protein, partial [Haloferula sp.]